MSGRAAGAPQPAHALILGCGRSGTSIFGELFEYLPGYTYRSEPPFAEVLDGPFDAPFAVKVPKESDGHPADPGLSFPLDRLLGAVPGWLELFWQVRHPLDAIASLRVGIASNWGHHPRPPDWRAWLTRPLVERCAHHWSHINSVGYARVAGRARSTRFEDMIADPLVFARGVCVAIGLDPHACDAGLHRWARRVQDTDNADFVEARTSRAYSRADHSRRVGRWRENLDGDSVRAALPIVADAARVHGYVLDG